MISSAFYGQSLTQQQRNNRRQRASPQQLAFLRKVFETNSRPDQVARAKIGKRIDMTPRSVQVWFQNNRAKQKKGASSPRVGSLRAITRRYTENISCVQLSDWKPHSDEHVMMHCFSVSVGNWTRVRCEEEEPDLWVFVSSSRNCLTYMILHDGVYYRMAVPFHAVLKTNLTRDPAIPEQGSLEVELTGTSFIEFEFRPVDQDCWSECSDFTGGEVMNHAMHKIAGNYEQLAEQYSYFLLLKSLNTSVWSNAQFTSYL